MSRKSLKCSSSVKFGVISTFLPVFSLFDRGRLSLDFWTIAVKRISCNFSPIDYAPSYFMLILLEFNYFYMVEIVVFGYAEE